MALARLRGHARCRCVRSGPPSSTLPAPPPTYRDLVEPALGVRVALASDLVPADTDPVHSRVPPILAPASRPPLSQTDCSDEGAGTQRLDIAPRPGRR